MSKHKKGYYISSALANKHEIESRQNLIAQATLDYFGSLSEEDIQLISGIESSKILEVIKEGEKIQKIFFGHNAAKNKKQKKHTEPIKMEENYKKLGPEFYKIFDDVIADKKQSGSKFLKKVQSINQELNQMITHTTNKNVTTFNRIIDSSRRLMEDIKAGKEVGFFDIETDGDNDITEFAYVGLKLNQNNELEKDVYSSVIGLIDDDKGTKYNQIENKLKGLEKVPRGSWTNQERVLVDTYSKMGHKNTIITPSQNGAIWTVDNLETSADGIGTISTALEGLKQRKKIGDSQKAAAALSDGTFEYQQQYNKMISKINSKEVITGGHNILEFDIPMLNRNASAQGLELIDSTKDAIFDLIAPMRAIGSELGKDFYYRDNMENVGLMRGLTVNQQEAITKYLFGAAGAEQHSAIKDTEQFASLFFTKLEDGTTFFERVFKDLENIDKKQDKIQYKYSGANSQLFYVSNSEVFNSYNNKSALNFTIDPVSGKYRTFNGYAVDQTGQVEKELFGQTGMRRNSLVTAEILDYEATENLISMLNPEDRSLATVPEMGQKKGYALVISPYHDKEMAKELGVPYTAGMASKYVSFHPTYDSLLEQMSHLAPIADIPKDGVINPIEENLKSQALKISNVIDGKVIDVTPDDPIEHVKQFRKLNVERYTNEYAAEQARKLTFKKYNQIEKTYFEGRNNKDEVMAYIHNISEMVSKNIPLTQDAQIQAGLGFMSNGVPKVYSETINKTANLAGYIYDQKPIFDEIVNQIKGLSHMQGTSKEATINRESAFTRAYNALVEHLSNDPVAIKNGKPTTIVGASSLDYVNIRLSDLTSKITNEIGTSLVNEKSDFLKVNLNQGGLVKSLANAMGVSNSPSVNLQGGTGYGILSKFVNAMNKTEEFKGALNFTESEIDEFANLGPDKFETAILEKLKAFTKEQRKENPSFGYLNETNTTQYVTEPLELIQKAFGENRALRQDAIDVIHNAITTTPKTVLVNKGDAGIEQLKNVLIDKMFLASKDEFEQSLSGLNPEDIKTALFNFDLQKKSVDRYAEELAKGISNSKMGLSIGDNNLFLSTETTAVPLDLPIIKAQEGVLFAKVGNTKNALFPYLNINKAIGENGLNMGAIDYTGSFEKGIDNAFSLQHSISYAYENGEDPIEATLRWMKNVNKEIRETSPSFQSITPRIKMEQFHQNTFEVINAVKYLQKDGTINGLVKQGLLPEDYEKYLKNVFNHEDLYESFMEMGAKERETFEVYVQPIIQAIAEHSGIRDENVRRMLRMATISSRDTNVADGKLMTSMTTPIGAGEYAAVGRPLMHQNLNSIQYRKDLIEKRLSENGISKHVKFGSVLSNPTTKFLESSVDKSTGYEMVNTFSAKFLALDQVSFNKMLTTEFEKADNAFERVASKIVDNSEKTKVAQEIYQRMKTLNLHEQELIVGSRMVDAALYKSQVQTVSSKKKFMIQFEDNLKTADSIETYKKLVPVINEDGTITYKSGMQVKKGHQIFTIEGLDKPEEIWAKNNGVLKYGFFNQYDEMIDEKDVNKLLSGKKFMDIEEIEEFLENTHGIESKYSILPKSMQRPKLIFSGAEKGVNDYVFVGAGTIDSNVKKILKRAGLQEDIGTALSDDYLEYLESSTILGPQSIALIKQERHLIGDTLLDLLDTETTGIQGIINQGIQKHASLNLMIESSVGLLRDGGHLDNPKVLEHLNNAFEGIATITADEVSFIKNAQGIPINEKYFKLAMEEANYTFQYGDKTIFGKLFEKNGVQGTTLYGSVSHNNDWGGGSSSKIDIKEVKKQIALTRKQIKRNKKTLENHNKEPYLTPEELNTITSNIKGLEQMQGSLSAKQNYFNAIEKEKGAVYSDRLDMVLNTRQYDKDTLETIKSKLSKEEFKKFFGHAINSEGVLNEEYAYRPMLEDWTNQIKKSLIDSKKVQETLKEVASGAYAVNFNDIKNRRYDIDAMQAKGFNLLEIDKLDFTSPGYGREIVKTDRNVYTNKLLIDFGEEFGDYRYLASSNDSDIFTGDTLIKESRKDKLSRINSLWNQYKNEDESMDKKEKIKEKIIKAREEYINAERIDISGKEGKMEDVLKLRLNNSHTGKVSMLPIVIGDEYDSLTYAESRLAHLRQYNPSILDNITIEGKTYLEHYSEGKVFDLQYKSEKALRDMGYFDEKRMRETLRDETSHVKALEEKMRHILSTKGDIALTQRSPIMMEGSGKPTLLALDPNLQDDQTTVIAPSSYTMKGDVDGDTLQTSMMLTKDNKGYMNYVMGDEDANLDKHVKAQRAYMMDRAVNQNRAFEERVQKDLLDDRGNSILDFSSVADNNGLLIDGKVYGALDGVSNITRQQALKDVAASKKYVDMATKNLTEQGRRATGSDLHKEVVKMIQEENAGNVELIDSLTKSYAISTKYNALLLEGTQKSLKGSVGEVNRVNKRIREAYEFVFDRTDETYSMNRSILENILSPTEEGAISAKKAITTVDPERLEQWRGYFNNIVNGKNTNKNLREMKSWLLENVDEKQLVNAATLTQNTSNMYRELTKDFVNDHTKVAEHYAGMYVDIIGSMSDNLGLKKLIETGYFDFGEKTKGVNSLQLINIAVGEDDNLIRGLAVKKLHKISGGDIGQIVESELFSPDKSAIFFKNRDVIADGRGLLKDSTSTGDVARRALKSTGDAFDKIVKGFDGKTLAMGALGLAGAILVSGFVGGNPSRPTQNQAEEDAQEQYYDIPSLVEQNAQSLQGKQQGYVVNINARTNKGKQHAVDTINQSISRSYNTNVNIAMNITDDKGNINDRYVEQLLAGAIGN